MSLGLSALMLTTLVNSLPVDTTSLLAQGDNGEDKLASYDYDNPGRATELGSEHDLSEPSKGKRTGYWRNFGWNSRYVPRDTDQGSETDIPGARPGVTYVVNADGTTEGENPEGIQCTNPGWGYAIVDGKCEWPMPIYVNARPGREKVEGRDGSSISFPEFAGASEPNAESNEASRHNKRQLESPVFPPRELSEGDERSRNKKRQYGSPFTTPPQRVPESDEKTDREERRDGARVLNGPLAYTVSGPVGVVSDESPWPREKRQYGSPFTTPPEQSVPQPDNTIPQAHEKRQYGSPFTTPPTESSPRRENGEQEDHEKRQYGSPFTTPPREPENAAQETQQQHQNQSEKQQPAKRGYCPIMGPPECYDGDSEGEHDDYRRAPPPPSTTTAPSGSEGAEVERLE